MKISWQDYTQYAITKCFTLGKASRILQYYVRGNGVKFDHHLVSCMQEVVEATTTSSFQKMNIGYFEEAKEKIHQMWHVRPKETTFFPKLRKEIKLYKEFCEFKTIELHTKIFNLRSSLELVQMDLQEAMQDGGVAT